MIEHQQADLFTPVDDRPVELLSPGEMFDRLDAGMLKELAEDRRIERKPASYSGDKLGELICMWSNTAPDGGIIVVGMTDDGAFEGVKHRGDKGLNQIEKCGYTFCPEATVTPKRIAVTNKKGEADLVVALRVYYHPNRVVKTTKGDAFLRIGDQKHTLRQAEVRELEAEKKQVSFETEPVNLDYPDDFDVPAIEAFVDGVISKRSLDEDRSTEDILDLLNLGRLSDGDFTPNVACSLLFAKNPRRVIPGCRIHFFRFDGDHEGTGVRWNAVKDEMIEGQVPHIIAQADKMLRGQVRTFQRLDPHNRFTPQPEYPQTAWYEALVNACVHRSYGNGLKNTDINLKMFDNRLVIESPGPFPPFVTPENIYDVSSMPKNPVLMDAMRYMDIVRCAREGTRRMRASMSEMELPEPEFEQKQVGNFIVRVTLRNNVHQRRAWVDRDVAEIVGAALAQTFDEDEKRLLNFAAEHGEISVSDAQRLLGGSTWPMAKKRLERLKDMGILYHDVREDLDRDPQARYRLVAS